MRGGILKGKDAPESWERHQLNTIVVHSHSQENKQESQVASLTKQRAHVGIQMKYKKKQRAVYKKVEERLLKRNIEALFGHEGMFLGELQLSWKLLGMTRATRIASSTAVLCRHSVRTGR